MPDPALRLAEKLADDITALEDEVEHLREAKRQLQKNLSALDAKVSAFITDYHQGMTDVTQTLALYGATIDRMVAKLRTANYPTGHDG